MRPDDYQVLVLEICSNKVVVMQDGVPLNNYYATRRHGPSYYDANRVTLSEQEMEKDLKKMLAVFRHIIIIPHVNLPLRSTGEVIPGRNDLVETLQRIVTRNISLSMIDTASIIRTATTGNISLEEVMPDGTHYRHPSNHMIMKMIQKAIQDLATNVKIIEFDRENRNLIVAPTTRAWWTSQPWPQHPSSRLHRVSKAI